jgi:4-hydroxyphenylpyruvate dioxygenase
MALVLKRLAAFEYYVHDLERLAHFYETGLGFVQVGRSSRELERTSQQRSLVFRAGGADVVCSSPLGPDSAAARYLSRHPEGVGGLVFEVLGLRRNLAALERKGATPLSDVETTREGAGRIESVELVTPFGDTTFRLVERHGSVGSLPGMATAAGAADDALGVTDVDHVTANVRTMKPALLWLEHVLGFEPFWGIEFHSAGTNASSGSGLRSQVSWHRPSGIKIAANEPLRPFFTRSQIDVFCRDNRGDGIQHVALGVRDIVRAVRALRTRGVELLPAPAGYYERLPEHLARLGIERIDEDPAALAELGILVDGYGPGAYLLQIFLKDAAGAFRDPEAGPFFFELIQRKGDAGFGAGNFRALFDGVEREQLARAG